MEGDDGKRPADGLRPRGEEAAPFPREAVDRFLLRWQVGLEQGAEDGVPLQCDAGVEVVARLLDPLRDVDEQGVEEESKALR